MMVILRRLKNIPILNTGGYTIVPSLLKNITKQKVRLSLGNALCALCSNKRLRRLAHRCACSRSHGNTEKDEQSLDCMTGKNITLWVLFGFYYTSTL